MSKAIDLSNSVIFPKGEKFDSDFFRGTVWLKMLTGFDTPCPIGNVTFEPGCINNWHKHQGGQILLVTGGRGYYQKWGKPAQELHPEMWCKSPRMSNTGMGRPMIAGLCI